MKNYSAKKKDLVPPTTEALYESAVKALARRARSSGEVRQMLFKKRAASAQIDTVLARLRSNGYLDDARFAKYYAETRLQGNLHGKARVRRDLAGKRLKPEVAQTAISEAYDGVSEAELLREHLRRKVHLSKPPSTPAAVASLHRRLLRAGFSSATIISELKKLLESPILKASGKSRGGIHLVESEAPSWSELLDSLSEASETSETSEDI